MKRLHGFSLVEMAIVLLILGLLIGGLLQPLSSQMEASRIKDTQTQLNNITDVLYGFAATNGRLPCPAFAGSAGGESLIGVVGRCSNPYDGFVPGRLLGIGPLDTNGYVLDAWGKPIHYAVADLMSTTNFTYPITGIPDQLTNRGIKYYLDGTSVGLPALGSLSNQFLSICNSATGLTNPNSAYTSSGKIRLCGPAANTMSSDALALLFSTGPNQGRATGTDEAENLNGDAAFVFKDRTEAAAAGGAFDDLMVWIPRSLLVSKMINAGQLP